MAKQTPAKQLYDALISKNFDPHLLGVDGMPAQDPSEADVFSFDYVGSSGQDYGTVVIMLGDEHNMTVYFGDNVGKSMEGDDKKEWFDFLYQLRMLAKRNLQSFSLQNLSKLKYNMKSMSTAVKEGLFESWTGTSTHSWNNTPTEARLMVKHSKEIVEGQARYRYVESLFIETVEGERFKLPFTKISAGKAMLEHIKQGGRPYDARGLHIAQIVNEMNVLSRFYRANRNVITEDEAEQQLIQEVTEYHANLKEQLGKIATKRGYTAYFESWNPELITEQDMVIEGIRTLFATESSEHRMERALPALTKIKTQGTIMKETGIFEGWINCLAEGTWELPDTPEKQQQLIQLLSKEFPVGVDGMNATEQLYNILGDDDLFDQLEALAEEDPNADARTIIINRLEQMASNPSVAQVIGKLKIEQKPAEEPQEPVAEEETLEEEVIEEENIDEEIQRITELSGDTLKSYIKKASSSGDERSVSNLSSRAAHKLNDPIDQDDYDDGEADDHKSYMRSKGIARAVDKLEEGSMKDMLWDLADRMEREQFIEYTTTEMGQDADEMGEFWDACCGEINEAEQLDELSPSTLGSYVKKASSDRAIRNFDTGLDAGKNKDFDWGNSKKDDTRRRGIHKAVDRLVKEDDYDPSPVEAAIIRRIMMTHPDLLSQYGPEAVMDAARDEAEFVGDDVDEIGSSDVSGWVKNVTWALEKSAEYQKSRKVDESADDVSADKRYSVNKEFTGHDKPQYVVRFQGDWIKAFDAPEKARAYAQQCKDEGWHLKEDELDEGSTVYDPITKKMVTAKRAKVKMGGGWRNTDPETGIVTKSSDESEIGKHKDELEEGSSKAEYYQKLISRMPNKEVAALLKTYADKNLKDLSPINTKIVKMLNKEMQDREADATWDLQHGQDKMTNEGTALQGQYGHAGKLQAVKSEDFGDKFAEDIARLKALALIK